MCLCVRARARVCVCVCVCGVSNMYMYPLVVLQSTSADGVQNIGVGSAMRRSLLFGSKSTHSMLQDTTNQDHTDVCVPQQQEGEFAGGKQGEKGEKGEETSKEEEGSRVEEQVMQASVSEFGCALCVE